MSDNFFDGIENQGGEFEVPGGNLEPIPGNTQLLAIIDEAGWRYDDYNEEDVIQLRWTVMQPEEYENRKVFQKLRLISSDPKKAKKAKKMLLAIDANAGGNIGREGRKPEDADLAINLMQKPMVIKVQVWEEDDNDYEKRRADGEKRRGNWVCAVSHRKAQNATPAPATQPVPVKQSAPSQFAPAPQPHPDDNDDIPF